MESPFRQFKAVARLVLKLTAVLWVIGLGLTWYALRGEHDVRIRSVSPDGKYRCLVILGSAKGSLREVRLEQRPTGSSTAGHGEDAWMEMERVFFPDSSPEGLPAVLWGNNKVEVATTEKVFFSRDLPQP